MTRIVEVRRHSYIKKGEQRSHGSHLSAEGVRLACRIGETIGPFTHVLVSDVPRTLETAIAMGFAIDVDEVLPFPDALQWEAVIEEMGWHALWEIEQPFAHCEGARLFVDDGAFANVELLRMRETTSESWAEIDEV